jgi:hypothetical protein
VVSVEVGGASGRRFAVRMGLFMWGGCERREGREEKGWAAARAGPGSKNSMSMMTSLVSR